jgi:lysophospholipase L1-like esterase
MLIDRLRYFVGVLFAIPLFPLMYWQARQLKKNFPDLPEAKNPSGSNGHGEPLELLMLGESSIAGVGVADHRDCISGQLAAALARLTGHTINWQVIAKSGYTATQVGKRLVSRIPDQKFDMMIIGLGGNDTFRLNTPWFWKNAMRELVKSLHEKHPEAQIVITCMPPVHTFIAFSRLFRFFLGNLTKLHGREMKRLAREFGYLSYFDYVVSLSDWISHSEARDPGDFFSDGVHPSALTYRLWGQDTARFIHESVMDTTSSATVNTG